MLIKVYITALKRIRISSNLFNSQFDIQFFFRSTVTETEHGAVLTKVQGILEPLGFEVYPFQVIKHYKLR